MTNHNITGNQMQSIFVMYWLGSLVVIGASKDTKQDYWISVLISVIFIAPMIILYCRLIKLYPEKNLFDILFDVFGKGFGRVISMLYVLFALHLGSMVTKVFSIFIRVVNMPETPEAITSSILILIAIMSVINGPENIGRVAKFTWKFVVVFIVFATAVGFKDMNFDNLLPMMDSDIKAILGSSYNLFALPLSEGILCLSFFSAVSKKENPYKILIKALAIAILTILTVALRNILILGVPSTLLDYFPSYQAISVVSIGEFFSRFEVLVGVNLMLAGFIKVCVCLYTSSLGLVKVLNIKDQKMVVAPCALIILTLSQMLYNNVQELFGFIPYYEIYAAPFEIILPIITLIGAEIRHRTNSGGSKGKNTQSDAAAQPQ